MLAFIHVAHGFRRALVWGALIWSYGNCAALEDQKPREEQNYNCSQGTWRRILALGLESTPESANHLAALRNSGGCAANGKLADILLKDRQFSAEELGKPVTVRYSNPDWTRLDLGGAKVSGRTVVLNVFIDADGQVSEVVLVRSNGNPQIDALCVETARSWLFRPAKGTSGYIRSQKTFTVNIEVRS